MPAPPTLDFMPRKQKKKSSGGKNTTPRKPVQFPTAWLSVAREQAKALKQPVLWYLISLVERDAREKGVVTFPPSPWDAHSSDVAESQDPPG